MSYMSAGILAVFITSLVEGLLVAFILNQLGYYAYDLAQYFYNNGNYYAAAAMQVLGDALNIFALNALFAGLGTLGNNSNQAGSGTEAGANGGGKSEVDGLTNEKSILKMNLQLFAKKDLKQVNDAAKEIGVDRDLFGEYIHEIKAELGMKASENFTYKELLEYAKELKDMLNA